MYCKFVHMSLCWLVGMILKPGWIKQYPPSCVLHTSFYNPSTCRTSHYTDLQIPADKCHIWNKLTICQKTSSFFFWKSHFPLRAQSTGFPFSLFFPHKAEVRISGVSAIEDFIPGSWEIRTNYLAFVSIYSESKWGIKRYNKKNSLKHLSNRLPFFPTYHSYRKTKNGLSLMLRGGFLLA